MSWIFPYSASTTTMGLDTDGNATAPFQPDYCPSSPGDDQQEADSISSPSAASFSSSSSSTDHVTFITSGKRSPSASPLCFGAGKLLWRSNAGGARAHVSNKKQEEEEEPDAEAAPKGDVVRRYLRKISRRLRKARAVKESPQPPCRVGIAVDDTARERAEAVASAVAYCKESLRRGRSTVRPVSSPSLDFWLQGWHEELIAAHCNDECTDSLPPPRQAGWLLQRQAAGTQRKESSRPPSPSSGDVSLTASAVAHGQESPPHGHDTGDKSSSEESTSDEAETLSSVHHGVRLWAPTV